jgi:hypothetical protein
MPNEMSYDEEKDATMIPKRELYEVSLVDIPDNPKSVVKSLEFEIKA